MIAAVSSLDLALFAYLWDGSEPGWCLLATHRQERRIVLHLEKPGPSARDVVAMRDVFEEMRLQPADVIWAAVRDRELLVLDRLYSPTDALQLTQAARDRGLHVEVCSSDAVSHVPYNDRTRSALIIDDDALALAVVNRMRREGVSIRIAEVD